MKELQTHKALHSLSRNDLDGCIDFLRSSIEWNGLARSAIHDLLAGILYLESVGMRQRPTLFCERMNQGYISFLGYCPNCSFGSVTDRWCPNETTKKGIIGKGKNKPESNQIGAICSDVTLRLLRTVLADDVKIATIGGQHEVDAIIKRTGIVSLWEIKSSPFFLPAFINDSTSTAHHQLQTHDMSTISITIPGNMSVFLIPESVGLGTQQRDLSQLNSAEWVRFASDFVRTWSAAYHQYRNRFPPDSNSYQLLVCSGSAKTDDSKNHPGINRTDDIKKGTYQALKFTGKYKRYCRKDTVYGGIISNVRPLNIRLEEYINDILDINIESDSGNNRRLCDAILSLDDPFGECLYDPGLRVLRRS
jgi:hypothetical protein